MADVRGGDAGHAKGKGHSTGHVGGGKKVAKRTAVEKKYRMSGKNTEKPYISSSMGDMVRLMQRMACTENTLGMTEPPPPEFYDFWTKFATSKSEEHLPNEFIDKRKVSHARIKMNTSSFDFTGKYTINPDELHEQALAELGKGKKGGRGGAALAATASDLWNDVRISMSTESFISSSTKVSESHDVTSLYHGWSDSDDEDLSESDIEMDPVQASVASTFQNIFAHQSSHHGGDGTKLMGDKGSSKHGNSQGSDTDAKANKGAGSLLQMLLEDQRVAMEQSLKNTKAEHETILDYFMDDLDDSFLHDTVSYGQLPDSAFIPEFDYFNEDPMFRQREKAKERKQAEAAAALQPKGKGKGKADAGAAEDLSGEGSDEEETEQEDRVVSVKQLKDDVCTKIDYATCVQAQRRRIEDRIKAAARKRSPMGSYRVPKGGKPLTHVGFSPGPAAYYPDMNAVKPRPKGANLVKRWQKSIYNTPGPGPAAYLPDCVKCTGEYIPNHFDERFPTDESVGPGPAAYDTSEYYGTAKDKPHALILSRHPWRKSQGASSFPNCFGISRFGRHNPPKAILLSKPFIKDKSELGPGAYDPNAMKDTRVGIILKSRIPELDSGVNPGYLNLPTFMGLGPGVPLGIRKFSNLNSDSPGPIYGVKPETLGGLSMTFRPFPSPGREAEPCPLEYGTKPGEMAIKQGFKQAPRAVMIGSHNLDYGIGKTPGPSQYRVKHINRKIGIKMKGKYGSKIEILPGPSDYNVGRGHYAIPPRTIFQSKPKDKELAEKSPGFKYSPVNPNHNNTRRIFISGKWPVREDDESGPPFYNLFGMTSRGNYSKIPVSLKSRHSPSVFTHVSTNAQTVKQCKGTSEIKNPAGIPKAAPNCVKC